ncbi:MAG: Mini-ribonuclease 3 [Defluviitaleaceae bacterium]|nr:Mini-ribonuclease 3 [Defluviitaleaceae bacterium]
MTAAALAYLGDAVFELRAREMLLAQGLPVHKAHRRAKDIVSATAQAEMYHRIFPLLTPEEQNAMRRGRNLNPVTRAKNAEATAYRHATGLEVLFGYLYINGNSQRLEEIFKLCLGEGHDK